MKHERRLAKLSEHELLDRFGDLVRRDRHNTAYVLATIAEIDERKLWAKHACPSMFAFCVERYHMSESVTAKRIWAARTARRFPVILNMVARGELTLSAIQLVSKHLTQENHRAVLARAKHKRTREIERLVAELAPKPDVPSRIRALPRTRNTEHVSAPGSVRAASPRGSDPQAIQPAVDGASLAPAGESLAGQGPTAEIARERPVDTPTPKLQLVPLAPRRYKLEITIDQGTHDKLRTLQDLMSHRSQGSDPAAVVSKAIDRLLAETLKAKAAVHDDGQRPRQRTTRSNDRRRTRAIPAAVRREVWRRDKGRCSFMDSKGRRCKATHAIQYHHETPYSRGGEHAECNIALRCRAHNQYEADLDFGRDFMQAKRGGDGEDSARNAGSAVTVRAEPATPGSERPGHDSH